MLAQNFKTAADLGISDAQFEGLIKTMGVLERGELTHVPIVKDWYRVHVNSDPAKFDALFNMDNVYSVADCGSAACIAGTCDLLFKTDFAPLGNLNFDLPESLIDLFCPPSIDDTKWTKITTDQAAHALRNYLTTGDSDWSAAAPALAEGRADS